MCHDDASKPPAPPGEPGAIAAAGDFKVAERLAYQAVPATPGAAAVVILPDMRGLHGFYRELADRFASAGIAALALDYDQRTAEDARAGVDHLAAAGFTKIFTVGFCLGGAISWAQSAVDDRVAGAIGFYGRPVECAALIPDMRAPLLVLAAGEDMLTSAEEARAFDRELTEHGVPHTFVLYEGAPHSFFDGGFAEHAEASADAWRRVLDFIAEVGR
jgi:carboxymethylenebutenolidase